MSRHNSALPPSLSKFRRLLAALFCATFCAVLLLGGAYAQDTAAVPHLVKFSGAIGSAPAGNVSVIFALYKDQSGGAPLWQEVQNLTVDSNGHYTALLGARSAAGIPLDVFSNGEARWLGVQAEGQAEAARVLLVSVPYALKASDAETLGGLPASAFVRSGVSTDAAATSVAQSTSANYVNTAAVTAAANRAVVAATSATYTAGYLPVFTDATGDLGNSLIAQSGSFVGIGTATPAALLSLLGTNPTLRIENYGPAGSGDSPNFNFYTGNGTSSAPTATLSGDNLGQFAAAGYTGTAFPGSKVKVSFVATENWSATANGTAMAFATTANGTTSRTERLRIDNTGNVGIGTTTPAYPLSVAGVIQSTTGGFKFPDGSTQTSAGLSGTVGIANGGTGAATAAAARSALGAAASGANADITSLTALTTPLPLTEGGTGSKTQNFVDLSSAQTIAGAKTFSASVAAGTAVSSPKYCIGTSCITAWPSAGSVTLPVTWSAAATAPAGVVNVTDISTGATMSKGSAFAPLTVPSAIVATATGDGTTIGVMGQATGNNSTGPGIGVMGQSTAGIGILGYSAGADDFPVIVAWSAATSGTPAGYDAELYSPSATGYRVNFNVAPTSGTVFQANNNATNTNIFSVDGSGNLSTSGSLTFNGSLQASSGLQVNAPSAVFNTPATFSMGLTANGGITVGGPGAMFNAGLTSTGTSIFNGNVNVNGTLSKASGSFKIDHPLDPANKYLYHSFVESPDMMNIYNGNIVTDRHGLATVELPSYFEALNQDFRYQLTVIGQFAQAIVVKEITKNRFTIKTNKPSVKVSWQVTGIRHDAYAEAHRIQVEENKSGEERGSYLHPELFNAKQYIAGKN